MKISKKKKKIKKKKKNKKKKKKIIFNFTILKTGFILLFNLI